MRKLKLDIEELAVESFGTHDVEEAEGTVRAHGQSFVDTSCTVRPVSMCNCSGEPISCNPGI